MTVNESFQLDGRGRLLPSENDNLAQRAMALDALSGTGQNYLKSLTSADNSSSLNLPNVTLDGATTPATAAPATDSAAATPAAAVSPTLETASDWQQILQNAVASITDGGSVPGLGLNQSAEPVGLSNTAAESSQPVLSAADIIAALSPAPPTVNLGNPSSLTVSNPLGAPEAAVPTSGQLSQVADATVAITSSGGQGTGTIVNYNGADYMVSDGHVTGTNPSGIADGTNTVVTGPITATTSEGTQLTLGQPLADPSNDLVAYPITGANGQYSSLPIGDESSLTQGQSIYSVNYGDGQLTAQSGTYLGQMPNMWFFPGAITPDVDRDVVNTSMSADPGASGAGLVTFSNGQATYGGTLDYGNGSTTQFTGASALKNLLSSAPPSDATPPAPAAPPVAPDATAPAAPEATAPAAPEATAPAPPEVTAPAAPEAAATAPDATAPAAPEVPATPAIPPDITANLTDSATGAIDPYADITSLAQLPGGALDIDSLLGDTDIGFDMGF